MTTHERFMSHVQIEPGDGCWLWTAYAYNGYGLFWTDRQVKAHRYSYAYYRGQIPDGMVIDHICRVRSCVNPDHLRVVTNKENLHAPGSESNPAVNANKTNCRVGHPLSGGNLHFDPKKRKRKCRTCAAATARSRWHRKKRLRDIEFFPPHNDGDSPL